MAFVSSCVAWKTNGSSKVFKRTNLKRKWKMGIVEEFAEAWLNTSVHRRRRKQLLVTSTTELPYVLLSPAEINKQETSVRRGTLSVEKPQIIVPGHKQNIADFTVCALSFPYFILIFRNLTMSGLRIYVIL
jgi:hypothetical protein